jgi:hypothetical protein
MCSSGLCVSSHATICGLRDSLLSGWYGHVLVGEGLRIDVQTKPSDEQLLDLYGHTRIGCRLIQVLASRIPAICERLHRERDDHGICDIRVDRITTGRTVEKKLPDVVKLKESQ